MVLRWTRGITHLSKLGLQSHMGSQKEFFSSYQSYSKVASTAVASALDSPVKGFSDKSEVNLNKMFWTKSHSLALAPDSPLRIEEPKYEGIRRIILKLLLFYSKQSKSIRGANVVYRRVISQVDKPAIYNVFNLEQTFKTTFSLLVLHMWLCLRRLKEEGKEGVEFGQYLYEIYNHDLELRVSKAGVNLLLIRWMKDLEKIFYGNIVAYDTAMLPEAKQNELPDVIWRRLHCFQECPAPMVEAQIVCSYVFGYWQFHIEPNLHLNFFSGKNVEYDKMEKWEPLGGLSMKNVFSDDGSSMPNDAASHAVQAMARYARRESTCLSLTDKEAIFSGNFMFTSLENPSPNPTR